MPTCVAVGCPNRSGTGNVQNGFISLFTFPKEVKRRRVWINAVGRTSLPKCPRLCSAHFEASWFEDSTRLRSAVNVFKYLIIMTLFLINMTFYPIIMTFFHIIMTLLTHNYNFLSHNYDFFS
uniref:THAP domain-containing protein 1 n=1 Tax=Gouania willdenowi TaxID=441366 RepID=A0A8C5I3F4_GOUWI